MIYLHFKWGGGGYSKSEVDTLLNGKSDTSHTHTVSDVTDFPTLATVATSGSYNDLSNKPATMTPTSHTHGNITNDGRIGSNANKPLITTTGGTVTTGSFGTTANTFCQGNDSRLSDARTPTAHTHSASDITSGLSTVATSGSYNDLSNKPTIPTVNNATLTIQKNGTNVQTFTANQSTNATANITVPTKTSDLTNDSGFLTSHQDLSGYIPKSGGQVFTGSAFSRTSNATYLELNGGTDWNHGAGISLRGKDCNTYGDAGCFMIKASDGTNDKVFTGRPNGALYWGSKNVAMQEDVVPRSGGAVITGDNFFRNVDDHQITLGGASSYLMGATVVLNGPNVSYTPGQGRLMLLPSKNGSYKDMSLYPDGTWTWSGTAVQITSDQRLKQQIDEIDDKLLDAWEDVNPVQFKYNDAVEEKSDKARLHTGYVVQQIDEACKSHGVDVSKYGLYCHEEYAEETREVEHDDGTKTTEVVRPANEHYSLRYTEALIVECAFLRRENARLKERLSKIEKLLNI